MQFPGQSWMFLPGGGKFFKWSCPGLGVGGGWGGVLEGKSKYQNKHLWVDKRTFFFFKFSQPQGDISLSTIQFREDEGCETATQAVSTMLNYVYKDQLQ